MKSYASSVYSRKHASFRVSTNSIKMSHSCEATFAAGCMLIVNVSTFRHNQRIDLFSFLPLFYKNTLYEGYFLTWNTVVM